MKIKSAHKMALSIVLAALFTLLFSKMAINLTFHEAGGLFLFGLLLIHIILNWKWVAAATASLFSKRRTFRSKLDYVVDILLFISIAIITVSGIFISKVFFVGLAVPGGSWKMIHYFSAACALILCGVHIGMNWSRVVNLVKKLPFASEFPAKITRSMFVIILAVFVVIGAYQLTVSNFPRWLSAPFLTFESESDYAVRGLPPSIDGNGSNGDPADANQGNNVPNNNGGSFKGGRNGRPNEFGGDGRQGKGGQNGGVLSVLFIYGSILTLFSAVTYYIDKILMKNKIKNVELFTDQFSVQNNQIENKTEQPKQTETTLSEPFSEC